MDINNACEEAKMSVIEQAPQPVPFYPEAWVDTGLHSAAREGLAPPEQTDLSAAKGLIGAVGLSLVLWSVLVLLSWAFFDFL